MAKPFRMPQDAVKRAGPGDIIYLRGAEQHGEFTHEHAHTYSSFVSIDGRNANSGEPNSLITLMSYPGEQAVIRGAFDADGVPIPAPVGGATEPLGSLHIQIVRNHWRIEGNVFARFTRSSGLLSMSQGEVTGAVFRNNTFDLGPWTGPDGRTVGGDHRGIGLSEYDVETFVFEDNVFLGRELFGIGSAPFPGGQEVCIMGAVSAGGSGMT